MIKLIVSDVDGTLLINGNTEIPANTIDMINRLQEQGVRFAVASGRQYANLKKLFKNVTREIIYICSNGALVIYKGKILNKSPLNRMLGMEIMYDIWNQGECEILLSGKDISYIMPKKMSYFHYLENVIGNRCQLVNDFNDVTEDFLKVSAYNEYGIDSYSKYFIQKWGNDIGDRVNIAVSGKCWIDFTNRFSNKGNAVAFISNKLKISNENIMTFGDSYNDLEMFEQSYFSYAMQHADTKIKQSARHITPDVESILGDVLRMH